MPKSNRATPSHNSTQQQPIQTTAELHQGRDPNAQPRQLGTPVRKIRLPHPLTGLVAPRRVGHRREISVRYGTPQLQPTRVPGLAEQSTPAIQLSEGQGRSVDVKS